MKHHEEIIFYGAGRQAKYLFSGAVSSYARMPIPKLEEGVCFVDADKRKHGTVFLGLPVMALEKALEEYPNADIYISLGFPSKYDVMGYLTEELGVEKSRIINYEPVEKYPSCEYLQGYALIERESLGFCFDNFGRNTPPIVNKGTNPDESLELFLNCRDDLVEMVRNGDKGGSCYRCRDIRLRYWPAKRRIKHLFIDDYNGCNIHCVYCDVMSPITEAVKPKHFNYAGFISNIKEKGLIDEDFRCDIPPGEITVHPYKDEVFRAIAPYPNVFFSNALVYNQSIAEILERGLSYIYVSLDAGTRESYRKIKRVDGFDIVCENLEKYSEHGAVELKYIVLPGINDNDLDAEGFINVCKRVNAQNVVLSRNYHGWQEISQQQVDFMVYLYKTLLDQGIQVEIPTWQFSEAENRRIAQTIEGSVS